MCECGVGSLCGKNEMQRISIEISRDAASFEHNRQFARQLFLLNEAHYQDSHSA